MGEHYLGQDTRPLDAVMPAMAQDIVTSLTAVLVMVLYGLGLWLRLSSRRDDRFLILLAAATVTVLMEPFACFMVKAHHPAVGAYALLRGFGVTVPVQLLFFYVLYFAPTGAWLIHRASQGVRSAVYWRDFIVIFVVLFGAEALAIHFGVWFFFGHNPLVVAGLPIWVAMTNIAAVYAWSVAAAYCIVQLRGLHRWWAVLAAPFCAIAVYAPTSLPAAWALHATTAAGDSSLSGLFSAMLALGVIAAARHLLAVIHGRLAPGLAGVAVGPAVRQCTCESKENGRRPTDDVPKSSIRT